MYLRLKASTDVKISTFLEKNGEVRLWITKWTFNDTSTVTLLSVTVSVSLKPNSLSLLTTYSYIV